MGQKFYIISHTHWDREWYQTFQKYRIRLVRMMDELIDLLDDDSEYNIFHLDGQTIPVEDYLEIRHYRKMQLQKLIEKGKLIIGPWYVMPDEFLVSGESLIRNLAKGIADSKRFSANPMRNGYLVDCFGHNSQIPQILKGFSINEATLFRGMGDYPKDQFWWEGADKSRVRVFKLCKDRSYSNFYFSLRWPFESKEIDEQEFKLRAEEMIERARSAATGNSFLLMDGVDHIDVEPELYKIINRLNNLFPEHEFKQSSIAEYTESVCLENVDLDVISGPLYSVGVNGLNNKVLKNVLSSIVMIKQANDLCETELTQRSEPWDAIAGILDLMDINSRGSYGNVENYVKDYAEITPRSDFIENAWKMLMQNHPHDSICGCSISDVHRDNIYRFRQVMEIAESMTIDAMSSIASRIDLPSCTNSDGTIVVFNSNQKIEAGIRQIILPLPANTGTNFVLKDLNGNIIDYKLIKIYMENEPEVKYRHLIDFKPIQYTKVIMPLEIPAMGYSVFSYEKYEPGHLQNHAYSMMHEKGKIRRTEGSMKDAPDIIDNGIYTIKINPNGTLDITVNATGKIYIGFLVFEDSGDCGDGWNYIKPVVDSVYMSFSGSCEVSFQNDSVLGTVFTINKKISIPKSYNNNSRSSEKVILDILAEVTVLKENPRIDVKIFLKNEASCHRLRILFPTGISTGHFYTKTPFDMQKWNTGRIDFAESSEIDTNVFPSQGITYLSDSSDSFALYTKGLYEVSLEDDISKTVALTLFRAHANETTKLNRDLSNLFMDLEFDIAFDLTISNPFEAWLASNDFRCPPNCFLLNRINNVWKSNHKSRSNTLKESESFINIEGDAVLSAFYKNPDNVESFILRIFNPGENDGMVSINMFAPIQKAFLSDFEGNKLEPLSVLDGTIKLDIKSKEIKTINLSFAVRG